MAGEFCSQDLKPSSLTPELIGLLSTHLMTPKDFLPGQLNPLPTRADFLLFTLKAKYYVKYKTDEC